MTPRNFYNKSSSTNFEADIEIELRKYKMLDFRYFPYFSTLILSINFSKIKIITILNKTLPFRLYS